MEPDLHPFRHNIGLATILEHSLHAKNSSGGGVINGNTRTSFLVLSLFLVLSTVNELEVPLGGVSGEVFEELLILNQSFAFLNRDSLWPWWVEELCKEQVDIESSPTTLAFDWVLSCTILVLGSVENGNLVEAGRSLMIFLGVRTIWCILREV